MAEAATPETRLQALLAEVTRHREALLTFRQSAYPEMVELHTTQLSELYAKIRHHCAENGLVLPSTIPTQSE
jgi:hypothetical protein